ASPMRARCFGSSPTSRTGIASPSKSRCERSPVVSRSSMTATSSTSARMSDAALTFNRILLDVPSDWADRSIVNLLAPPTERFHAYWVVTSEPVETDAGAESYGRSQAVELMGRVREYRVHHEESLKLPSGADAWWLEHSFRSPDLILVRQIQLFTIAD